MAHSILPTSEMAAVGWQGPGQPGKLSETLTQNKKIKELGDVTQL